MPVHWQQIRSKIAGKLASTASALRSCFTDRACWHNLIYQTASFALFLPPTYVKLCSKYVKICLVFAIIFHYKHKLYYISANSIVYTKSPVLNLFIAFLPTQFITNFAESVLDRLSGMFFITLRS